MPLTRLDTDQRNAASAAGAEVVVSAGAGSGKTRLLVGRYLHLLESRAVAMHEIAAITFTEKAANQMKVAIAEQARTLAGRNGRDRDYWLGVANTVHDAPISTIHGFCNAILRSHPVEGRLDPLFDILDSATASALAREAVDSFIRRRLDGEAMHIEQLIRDFGLRNLKRMFLDLLGQRARLITWLDRFGSVDAGELEHRYESHLFKRLAGYRANLERFHALAPGDDSLAGKLGELLPALEIALGMMEDGGLAPPVIDDIIKVIGSLRGGSKNKWNDRGCDVSDVKGALRECRDFLGIVREYYRRDKGVTARTARDLLAEFTLLENHFLSMKKARSAFDHDDTLIETWRLLRTDIAVRQEVVRSLRHIMVDEFQDTDGLQMDILQMIVGNGTAAFFAVGDPKQSIYRFRGADVAIFNEYVTRVSEFRRLRRNYRSDPGIIAFVNLVFGRIMSEESGGGVIQPFEAVYSDMKPPVREPVLNPVVDVVVFEHSRGEAWRPREAAWIAGRMLAVHEQENVPYGHMALILRKSTHAPVYQEALLSRGIPYVDLAGNKPFAGEEARDIATLLGWLCAPEDPAALAALLLSPFIAAEAGHLFALRRIAGDPARMPGVFMSGSDIPGHPWFDGLDVDGVRDMLSLLLVLRDRASIREVLETAFDLTGYTAMLLADPVRGELALSVTDLVLDAADSFEHNGGNIREFTRMLASGDLDAGDFPGLESTGDAVNIITIHKAKGLEYDAVFCADIAGKTRHDIRPVVIDRELGIGFTMRDTCGKSVRTIVSAVGQDIEKRRSIAESKRLFYVACTRAKSRLFLTGDTPPANSRRAYDSDNWMEWLHTALELSPAGDTGAGTPGDLFRYHRIPDDDRVENPESLEYWRDMLEHVVSEGTPLPVESKTVKLVEHLIAAPTPFKPAQPSHLSPSQIEDYLSCPRMYRYRHVYGMEARGVTGSGGYGPQYGSYVHRILERWDFRESPDALIAGSGAVNAEWTAMAADQLARFRETVLYRVILAAETVGGEVPFGFMYEGVMVRGAIDCLVDRGDRRLVVIDFKTDRIDPGTAGEAARKYRLQLAMYALAVRQAAEKSPESLALYFLDSAETVSLPCTEALLEDAGNAIEHAAKGISRNEFAARPGKSCEECGYRYMCGI